MRVRAATPLRDPPQRVRRRSRRSRRDTWLRRRARCRILLHPRTLSGPVSLTLRYLTVFDYKKRTRYGDARAYRDFTSEHFGSGMVLIQTQTLR
eukprot:1772918-Prymnesium_polylepis.1